MTATQQLRGLASIIPTSDPALVPLGRQRVLLYGEPKIGKTTLAAQWPNALFLDAEAGTLNLAVPTFEALIGKDRVSNPIRTWEEVLQATAVLSGIESVEGTVVIDPVNEVYQWCRDYVLRENGWTHETDGAYGKGWRAVNDEFAKWCRKLVSLPLGIVFVAHAKDMEVDTPTEKYQKSVPRLDSGVRNIVEPMVDIIMYAHSRTFPEQGIHEPLQVVQTKPTKQVTAGERGSSPRLPLFVYPMTFEALNAHWVAAVSNTEETAS